MIKSVDLNGLAEFLSTVLTLPIPKTRWSCFICKSFSGCFLGSEISAWAHTKPSFREKPTCPLRTASASRSCLTDTWDTERLKSFFFSKIYLTSVNLKCLLQMADSLNCCGKTVWRFWENFGCYNYPSNPEKKRFQSTQKRQAHGLASRLGGWSFIQGLSYFLSGFLNGWQVQKCIIGTALRPEASVMVQWLRIQLQCEGLKFNPWLRNLDPTCPKQLRAFNSAAREKPKGYN